MLINDLYDSARPSPSFLNAVLASRVCAFLGSGQFPPLYFSSVRVDQRPAETHLSPPEEDAQAADPGGGRFQDDPQPAAAGLSGLVRPDFCPHTALPRHSSPTGPSIPEVSVFFLLLLF